MGRIDDKARSEKGSQGDKTILVVDDEDLMLRLLQKYFSRHGYRVLVASDGEQALACIGGEEVFRRMKGENAGDGPCFFDPLVKAELDRAGVKHCVNKPYALDALLEIFRSMIER